MPRLAPIQGLVAESKHDVPIQRKLQISHLAQIIAFPPPCQRVILAFHPSPCLERLVNPVSLSANPSRIEVANIPARGFDERHHDDDCVTQLEESLLP